jgi:transposase
MDERQIKGLQIAKTSRIRKDEKGWVVPSQTGHGNYHVETGGLETVCDCPDCQTRQVKCKHQWAVEFYIKREIDEQGNQTITKAVKVTYAQDWSAYNKSQTQEGGLFMKLLSDLCGEVGNKPYVFGRPKLPMSDMVFASALKVYSTFSLRRFVSLMKSANEKGFTNTVCSYSTVSNYMRSPEMITILLEMVKQSSLALASVEKNFAVDSSGFSTCRFKRWYSFKYGKESNYRVWIKAHIMCGTKTNVVTSIKLSESVKHDNNFFEELVKETAKNFEISEVSADKAYSSRENLNCVQEIGGTAFIPFRSNATGKSRGSMVWNKMYHYFQFNREEFLQHYHKRSNVETVFHMVKSKFGDSLRSKDKTAQINEVLLKFLCHNVCVAIQEMNELGIMPNFCLKSEPSV